VRIGPYIHVSGTTATNAEGRVVGVGDAGAQTEQALANIAAALAQAGAGMEHVVRTRIYVTDISQWQQIAQVHARYFAEVRPAATMVEVRRLIDPDMLVEVEADAYVVQDV
jgi:enamine deaminase RidA (YjgF/YER057c/UK114 family)